MCRHVRAAAGRWHPGPVHAADSGIRAALPPEALAGRLRRMEAARAPAPQLHVRVPQPHTTIATRRF